MNILFSQKIRITLGAAALLLVGIVSNNLSNNHSQNQQIAQKPKTATQDQSQIFQATIKTTLLKSDFFQNTPITQALTLHPKIHSQNPPNAIEHLLTKSISYPIIDEWKKYRFSVNGNQILAVAQLPTTKVNFNQSDLLTVLVNTRQYFQEHASEDPDILRTGLLNTQKVTTADIFKTLDFMIDVLKEDIANNRITRLQDPTFINKNFRVIKWTAYNPENNDQKQLRITKYAVFTHPGSRKRTSTYNTPIYSLKNNSLSDKFYTRYTKQDVLSGIYEPGGREFGKVQPLAYLTRTGLEEALMQGTVLVNLTDGSQAFFNVDKNNGMSYVRGLRATSQKRYWYFRQVDSIKGYGYNIDSKISIKPGVTFAGDVLNIGLGRIVVIEHNQGGRKQLQMGVIADTGGAFLPNLHQLDFLAGIFPSQKAFGQYISQLPEYATAYFLVKK